MGETILPGIGKLRPPHLLCGGPAYLKEAHLAFADRHRVSEPVSFQQVPSKMGVLDRPDSQGCCVSLPSSRKLGAVLVLGAYQIQYGLETALRSCKEKQHLTHFLRISCGDSTGEPDDIPEIFKYFSPTFTHRYLKPHFPLHTGSFPFSTLQRNWCHSELLFPYPLI